MRDQDPDVRIIDELVRSGRVELWWGSSNIRFVQLRDRVTGLRASGRSYHSWEIAHKQAALEMRRLLGDAADE